MRACGFGSIGLVVVALASASGCATEVTSAPPHPADAAAPSVEALHEDPPPPDTADVPDPTATVATTGTTATAAATGTTTAAATGTTTPAAPETSTSAPSTIPTWPRRITMAFTGDTLPHSPLWRRAADNAAANGLAGYDFTPMLIGLRPVLDTVDLAVCHLETPIAPFGEEYSTSPFYGVPAEIADAIAAAGFDRCSTASNHTVDRGGSGIDRTVEVLEAAGITQAGMARRPEEIAPAVFDVAGVPVAHLSYTWSYNGLALPADEEWRSALIDPDRIVADAELARGLGAAVVVVSLHWGAEGVPEPTRYQRTVAEEITAPGTIDLVVGHHAHVVQPIERVNDTWVVYGLGNILSNLPTSSRWPAASQDAVVVTVGLSVDVDGGVAVERPEAVPTWVDKDAGWVVRLVDRELARDDLGAGRRGRLEASRARTEAVLDAFLQPSP